MRFHWIKGVNDIEQYWIVIYLHFGPSFSHYLHNDQFSSLIKCSLVHINDFPFNEAKHLSIMQYRPLLIGINKGAIQLNPINPLFIFIFCYLLILSNKIMKCVRYKRSYPAQHSYPCHLIIYTRM